MFCVTASARCELVIQKSRFLSLIAPCQSLGEVQTLLDVLHREHPHASHIVYAYRIKTDAGLIARFYDAGEPSGTAGKPIYQHLEGKQLVNTLIAVVRYFGGVKLGAGGLTRAYGQAAKDVIAAARLVPYVEYLTLDLELDYADFDGLQYWLKQWQAEIIAQHYGARIAVTVRVLQDYAEALRQRFAPRIQRENS